MDPDSDTCMSLGKFHPLKNGQNNTSVDCGLWEGFKRLGQPPCHTAFHRWLHTKQNMRTGMMLVSVPPSRSQLLAQTLALSRREVDTG